MFTRIKTLFFPLALFLFIGNTTYAQNLAEIKRTSCTADARKRSLQITVNRDIARFDSIVPLSPGQRSLLRESFMDIEAKKYMNVQIANPNRVNASVLDKDIYKQEVDELEDILRPKQLKVWNQWNKPQSILSTAGTH